VRESRADFKASHQRRTDRENEGEIIVMALLPGWNSIETTTVLRNFFELGGIALFLVVVAFEFLAYFYGHRRDWLVDEAARIAGIQRARDEAATQQHHDTETAQIRQQLADAEKAVREAQGTATEARKQQGQRTLSPGMKETLTAALSPFRGQKVTITSIVGDGDGDVYARDFLSVLDAAGWNTTDVTQSIIVPTPSGVQVTMNDAEARAGRVLQSVEVFAVTLHAMGVTDSATVFINSQVPVGDIQLIVGNKPRP
jgi:hypothetical protein